MTDAFATVTRDLPWLRALAARLAGGDPDLADDLVQDTLEVASRQAPAELESSRGWLATVLRNRVRMHHRGDARRSAREQAAAPAVARSDTADELARMELLAFVMARLQTLPELDRRIVTLRYFDDLDATTIGQRLAMPAATVRSRLQRTLAKLRADLDERCGNRRAWTLVLGVPIPSRTATTFFGTITTMSIASKLGLGAVAIAAATATWFVTRAEPSSAPVRTAAAAPDPAPVASTPSTIAHDRGAPEIQRTWQARRTAIRARLPKPPVAVPVVDEAELATQARRALTDAFEDCAEDADAQLQGRIVLRATMIGSPDEGTVFDAITSVDETTHDPALLECLIESSYAYSGPAPSAAVETTTTVSWLGGQPEAMDDDTWRQSMFDAVFEAHSVELDACASGRAVAEPVKVALEFAKGPSPIAARVEGDELPRDIGECMAKVLTQWRFPRRFEGRTMTTTVRLGKE
jgi:RNA polymerase sigma-70 factor (ECF subfamily)